MKKIAISITLAITLLALTVIVALAGGINSGDYISVNGSSISGSGYTQLVGQNAWYVSTKCDLMVQGYSTPALSGSTASGSNTQAQIWASVGSLSTAYHHGERMYTRCYHYILLYDYTIYNWYGYSNTITIP